MRHFLGLDELVLRTQRRDQVVIYDPTQLLNAHVLLCGMSGTGKSFQTKRLLESAAASGVGIDIFDVHEELDDITGAQAVKYSQATGYGYNPLTLDTDPHVGGVNRQIEFLVSLIKEVSPQLGVKQEGVLRHLIRDTYAVVGITPNHHASWRRQQITERQRTAIHQTENWHALRNYYPTLDDMRTFAMRKITALTLGGDNAAVTAYEQLRKLNKQLTKLKERNSKAVDDPEIEKISLQIKTAQDKAIETYTTFARMMTTGREPDDVIKYDSVEVLSAVVNRLDLLGAAGTFRANPPPFGNAQIRVHQIKALTTEQQILFTKLRLRSIFEELKKLGPTRSGTELRHVVFLDEAHKYFSPGKSDDIIAVIAKEARKFGLGLWCASQQPTEFPESFLTNVGATFLLGVHSSFWKRTTTMLRITEEELRAIRPKEVMAVKLMRDGESDPAFSIIAVPNPKTEAGRRAAARLTAQRAA